MKMSDLFFASSSYWTKLALACALTLLPLQVGAEPRSTWEPQECPRQAHTDTYHGVTVSDPYRWLEDLDSPATKQWIKAQTAQTDAYLQQLPGRSQIRRRLDSLQNYEKFGAPLERGGRVFFSHNSGLQNQSVICVIDDPEKSPQTVRTLLDPNTLSSDGTVAVTGWEVSSDGRYLAYGTAEAGSDWNTWRVKDVASGKDLKDRLNWVKFSGASWDGSNQGFYYSRYPAPQKGSDLKAVNHNHTLYYHRLGTDQKQDLKVLALPEHPDWNIGAEVSEDGRWLCALSEDPVTDMATMWVKRLDLPDAGFEILPNAAEAHFYPIDIDGDVITARSDYQAPNFRLLSCDLSKPPAERQWTELVPEQKMPLSDASRAGDSLFLNYYQDAHSKIMRCNLQGRQQNEIKLPGLGSAGVQKARHSDGHTYIKFTNFTTPATIYRCNISDGSTSVWKKPHLTFDDSQYTTEQVFFTSADGCRVPMFISSRKGLKKDGSTPVLMYGYGGFNIGLSPFFSVVGMKWMEMGGAYVVVNLRGGDEYGSKWHEMGTKTQKQNVFNDFIAAGHYLVDHKYTAPQRLAIMGGSNGGLLVGACLNQAPGLFGAAVPQVGVMDMLRFSQFTIGYYWVPDYGDVKKEDEFKALYAYSPYHNIAPGTYYPPTLITTADHDDRVYPAHSFKYAAALQHAQAGDAPILIRIETRAGHGGGKPTSKRLDESADLLAFLIKALHMEDRLAENEQSVSAPAQQ